MSGNEWVYVAIATLLCAHLLTLLYAYRVNRSDSAFEASPIDETGGPDETTVSEEATGPEEVSAPKDAPVCRCPECGTQNDSTYRFCRQCVAELPTEQLHIEHPGRQQQTH